MEVLYVALGTLSLTGFAISHGLTSRKSEAFDARSHYRAALYRKYALIELMFKIAQVHVPEYGAMMEMLVTMRLKSVKSLDPNSADEVHQEVFDQLSALIKAAGYVTANDSELRSEFELKLAAATAEITAAHAYYAMTVESYNSLARPLGLEALELYEVVSTSDETPEEPQKKTLERLIG